MMDAQTQLCLEKAKHGWILKRSEGCFCSRENRPRCDLYRVRHWSIIRSANPFHNHYDFTRINAQAIKGSAFGSFLPHLDVGVSWGITRRGDHFAQSVIQTQVFENRL
jgi:hypothetical protein